MVILLIILMLLISVSFLYITIKKGISTIITIILTIIIFFMILSPEKCIKYTLTGTKLFFTSVFPSLLPFLIICNILIQCGGVEIYSRLLGRLICRPLRLPTECSIVLVVSALCGYPLGAKYTYELYNNNIIDYDTSLRLINIATNPSPLFVIGTLGTSILGSTNLGYTILIACYLSCIAMSIIIPSKKPYKNTTANIHSTVKIENKNFIGDSIVNAVNTSLMVGGYIVIFYVVTSMFKDNLSIGKNSILNAIMTGILEMTNGCISVSLCNINTVYKLAIMSFFIAFSGLCVLLQAYSFISKINIPFSRYVYYKLIQGVLCSIICIILYKLTGMYYSIATMNSIKYKNLSTYIYVIQILLLAIPTFICSMKKLFDIS